MHRRLVPIAAILCIAAAAQQASDRAPRTASITGTVYDAVSDQPLKKARVSLIRLEGQARPRTVTTGADGKFALANINEGRYRLAAERAAYARMEYGQRSPSRPGPPITIKPGQKLTEVVFRMARAAVITGRVIDEDNEPMPNVNVSALQYRYRNGTPGLAPAERAETDDRGEYRIFGLPAGRYVISAEGSGGRRGAGRGRFFDGPGPEPEEDEKYLTAYFPGTLDSNQAVLVQAKPGDEAIGIDFKLEPSATFRISGVTVDGESDRPLGNVRLFLMPREESGRFVRSSGGSFVRDSSGKFEMAGVAPGAYLLFAQQFERGSDVRLSARVPVDIGRQNLDALRVALGPGASLEGTLKIEGADAEGIDLTKIRVGLRGRANFPGIGGAERTEADGAFSLNNVMPGSYDVLVYGAPENAFVKAVALNGRDALEPGIELTSSGPNGNLTVVVSLNGGRVAGAVVNEKKEAVPGAQVVLLSDKDGPRGRLLAKSATADQYGAFTMQGVSPGGYEIYAWDDIEPGAWEDPSFIEIFRNEAKAVKVEEGSQLQIEVPVIEIAMQ